MNVIKLVCMFIAITSLFGCASGAKIENMVYTPTTENQYDPSLKKAIGIDSVSGGEETNAAWTSEISNQSFSQALKNTLNAEGLLSDNGRYQLAVEMLEVEQPLMGLDMTVTTHVQYTLTDSTTDQVIFSDIMHAPYTATIGDAFTGVKRLQMANEGSGKKNIEALLNKLTELKLNGQKLSIAN